MLTSYASAAASWQASSSGPSRRIRAAGSIGLAKGLYNAVMSALQGYACVQRRQYHKRKNVESFLPKEAAPVS